MCIEYMQDLNLFLGFTEVLHLDNTANKQQATKGRVRSLMTAYVKACNKHQLIVLDRHTRPFSITGGSIFAATGGSVARFMDQVANKLGRELTKREYNFVHPQFTQLIKRQREEGGIITNTKIGEGSLKTFSSGDANAWNRLMQQGGDKLKSVILSNIATGKTRAKNMDWRYSFDFTVERLALKARLKMFNDIQKGVDGNGYCQIIKKNLTEKEYKRHCERSIDHHKYNELLKILKVKKEDVELFIKTNVAKSLRDKQTNRGAVRVNNNIAGSKDFHSSGSRFTEDGYEHDQSRISGTTRGLTKGDITEREALTNNKDQVSNLSTSFADCNDQSLNIEELARYCRALLGIDSTVSNSMLALVR